MLGCIVAANGCVVHGEAMRSGHRATTKDGKGLMKGKLKQTSRISTLACRPLHPDALEEFQKFSDEVLENLEASMEEVENELQQDLLDIELLPLEDITERADDIPPEVSELLNRLMLAELPDEDTVD